MTKPKQPKFAFANLKSSLKQQGVSDADFHRAIVKTADPKPPSQRSWAAAMQTTTGVTEVSINKMKPIAEGALKHLAKEFPDDVLAIHSAQ